MTEEFKAKLAAISAGIQKAEEEMRESGACIHVQYGDLEWDKYGRQFRIIYSGFDRPLIEVPIEERVKGYKQIPLLREAIRVAAQELLKDIDV